MALILVLWAILVCNCSVRKCYSGIGCVGTPSGWL